MIATTTLRALPKLCSLFSSLQAAQGWSLSSFSSRSLPAHPGRNRSAFCRMGCAGSKSNTSNDADKDAAAAEIQNAAHEFLMKQNPELKKDVAAEEIQEMASDLLAKVDPEFRRDESAADMQAAAMAFLKQKEEEKEKAAVAA